MQPNSLKKWLPIIGIVLIVAFAVARLSLLHKGGSRSRTYKIGLIVPLTGGGSSIGQPLVNGLNLFLDELNGKSGIHGQKVVLNVQDSKLEGKTSVDAVNYLLNVENPDIISVIFGPPAQAVSPILEAAKKPWLYEAYIRSPLNNPYTFKANFDALTGCEKLIRYAKDKKLYHKLGFIGAKAEFNQLCVEGIKHVEPSLEEYWYNFGDKDLRNLFTKAKADGVDRLMTIGFDYDYVNMFKQLTELGYPIKMACAIASECIFPGVVSSASPRVLDGTLSIDFVPQNIGESEFGKRYQAKYPNPSYTEYAYGAIGYEEGSYLTNAMSHCQPGDNACLMGALEKVSGYKTVINSRGFKERVLQLDTTLYEYHDGKWNPVQ